MKQKTKSRLKKNAANAFGGLGYLFCLLQWVWALMLYFSVIQSMEWLSSPGSSRQQVHAPELALTLPGPLQWAFLILITVGMVALTLYFLVKMPLKVVQTSNHAVHKAADTVAPIVIKAQHKKVTQKSRVRLASKLVFVIKLLIVIVPVALSAGSGLLEKQAIAYSIAMIISYGLASLSVGSFAVQYVAARILRVKTQELW